ncbi:MAG TPA: DUF3060 domain-containing protein [Kofleriaceae bacterium]|jgi:hypothetical protein
MRKLLFVALVVSGSVAAADVSIVDNNQTVTVDCAKDPSVSIAGNGAKVTLTGTCKAVVLAGNKATVTGSATSVSIAGNENTGTFDSVDSLSITGNQNTVTYKKASDAKKKTKVSNLGTKNAVTQAK